MEILGPARAALPRIKRRFRGQLLLKGGLSESGKEALLGLLEQTQAGGPGRAKLDLALDVDPLSLL